MKIGIAGAGLLGRIIALMLVERGHQVTLVDADEAAGHASCGYAGAGMLAPYAELGSAEPLIHRLGMASMTLWKQLVEQIGGDVFLQSDGSLIVAHAQDEGELESLHGKIMRRLPSPIGVEWIDQQGIAKLEPELSGFKRALYLPFEGQIASRQFFDRSTTWLRQRLQWLPGTAIRETKPGRLLTSDGAIHVDVVIDCRGTGGKQHFGELRGVRGELIHLYAKDVQLQRPIRLMHPRYPLYVVPRPNHHFLVGATMIESDDMSGVSVQSALELLSAAFSLHPGFAEARITSLVTHCRPALRNHLPRLSTAAGLIAINGLYRHGYLIGPAIAQAVVEWLEKGDQHNYFPEIFHEIRHEHLA